MSSDPRARWPAARAVEVVLERRADGERVQPMNVQERIEAFLAGAPHAVVGASTSRQKYGNKVLRAFLQHRRPVYPVHPTAAEVEGLQAYPDLASLPEPVHGVSIITHPEVTERVIEEAGRLGIGYVWMQPGAESERAVTRARELGIETIAGGPCILVRLGFREG